MRSKASKDLIKLCFLLKQNMFSNSELSSSLDRMRAGDRLHHLLVLSRRNRHHPSYTPVCYIPVFSWTNFTVVASNKLFPITDLTMNCISTNPGHNCHPSFLLKHSPLGTLVFSLYCPSIRSHTACILFLWSRTRLCNRMSEVSTNLCSTPCSCGSHFVENDHNGQPNLQISLVSETSSLK